MGEHTAHLQVLDPPVHVSLCIVCQRIGNGMWPCFCLGKRKVRATCARKSPNFEFATRPILAGKVHFQIQTLETAETATNQSRHKLIRKPTLISCAPSSLPSLSQRCKLYRPARAQRIRGTFPRCCSINFICWFFSSLADPKVHLLQRELQRAQAQSSDTPTSQHPSPVLYSRVYIKIPENAA